MARWVPRPGGEYPGPGQTPSTGPHRPTHGCRQGPRDPTQTCGLPLAPCRPKAWLLPCGTHTERPAPARPGHSENSGPLCKHLESTPLTRPRPLQANAACLSRGAPSTLRGPLGWQGPHSWPCCPAAFSQDAWPESRRPPPLGKNTPPGGGACLDFLPEVPELFTCGPWDVPLWHDKQLPANPVTAEPVLPPLTWPLCGSSSLRLDPKTQNSETSDSLQGGEPGL